MTHAAPSNETPNRFIPSPKVRLWLYGIAVAVAAILVFRGILTAGEAGLWVAAAGAFLGVTSAIGAANVPRG